MEKMSASKTGRKGRLREGKKEMKSSSDEGSGMGSERFFSGIVIGILFLEKTIIISLMNIMETAH